MKIIPWLLLPFICLLSHIAEATDREVTQIAPRPPPSSFVYQRSLLDRIKSLQQKNDELSKSLQDLQVYRDWILLLEKRVGELEQTISEADSSSKVLQRQIRQQQAHIQQLSQERATVAAELQKYQGDNQALQKQLQESDDNATKLKDTLQSVQAALADREQQLQNNQDTIAQLQQERVQLQQERQTSDQRVQKASQQNSFLNEQLQIKTKKIKDLFDDMDALNLKYTALNKTNIITEQKLKKLETSEANCQKALSQIQADNKDLRSQLEKERKNPQ